MILSFKKLLFSSFLLCFLNLQQICVYQVPAVLWIKSSAMLIDHLLVKQKHLLSVLCNLQLHCLSDWQVLSGWNVIDHVNFAKQTHAFFDEICETQELGIVLGESDGHEKIANDIADRNVEEGAQFNGLTFGVAQSIQEVTDFSLH